MSKDDYICPHCGVGIDVGDSDFTVLNVTYWGEDPSTEWTCGSCEEEFKVKEIVRRTWEFSKP